MYKRHAMPLLTHEVKALLLEGVVIVERNVPGKHVKIRRVVNGGWRDLGDPLWQHHVNCPFNAAMWVQETWALVDGKIIYKADNKHPAGVKWRASTQLAEANSRLSVGTRSVQCLRSLNDREQWFWRACLEWLK